MTKLRLGAALWICGLAGCGGMPDGADLLTVIEVPDMANSDGAPPVFARVLRYSTSVPQTGLRTDFYFPDVGGDATEAFQLAFFLQGGNVENEFYSMFASRVAAYGFMVAVPNNESFLGILANISATEGTQEFVAEANVNPESPLAGLWQNDAVAILGHSFGGVAALDAVQDVCRFPFCRGGYERPDNLAAASVFGTNQCGPNSCEDTLVENDGIPVQLIQGSIDGLAELPDTVGTFGRIQSSPKQLLTVDGANHYGMTDVNDPEGSESDPNPQTISQSTSVETIARWTGTFLRAYMLDDETALDYIARGGAESDPNIESVFTP